MSTFDIEAAKKAGYSDQEITEYLAKDQNFDIAGAQAAGYSQEEIFAELQKVSDPTWTQRWSQAMSGAMEGLNSPEVTEAYKDVDLSPQPYYGPGQAVPHLDPVTNEALMQGVGGLASDLYAYGAAGVDMAGEKLGILKDDLPNVPLMDQQYKAFNERLKMLEMKRGSLERSNRKNQAQGMAGTDLTDIDAEIADLQQKISGIETHDPDVATRFIPNNPSIGELREKHQFYEPTSPVTKAYGDVAAAALHPVGELAQKGIEKATEGIEDPLEKRYAQEAVGYGLEAAALPAGVVGGKIVGAGVRGAAKGAGRVASSVADRVRDFRYKRSPEGKIETEIANIQTRLDEVPAVVQQIKQDYPNDPATQKTLIEDLKRQADDMRVERAKMKVELARTRASDLNSAYKSWFGNYRKRQPNGSGARTLAGSALQYVTRNPKSVIASGILDVLAAKATGGASLFYSGGNAARVVLREGINSFKDYRAAKGNIQAASDIPPPKLGDADFDALVNQLPEAQQKVIRDYQNGNATEVEVIDLMDEWVNNKKTPEDWLKEQADIEADSQRMAQEEAMFRQREMEDVDARADEAKDLEQRRIRQTPEEGDLALEEIKLRRDEAAAMKEEFAPENQTYTKGEKSEFIPIDEAIKMAEVRAARKGADMKEVDALYKQKEQGVTEVPRATEGSQTRTVSAADRKAYEDSFTPEEKAGGASAAPLSAGAGSLRDTAKGKAPNQIRQQTLEDFQANPPKGSSAPKDTMGMVAERPEVEGIKVKGEPSKAEVETGRIKLKYGLDGIRDKYTTNSGKSATLDELVGRIKKGEKVEKVIDEIDFTETVKTDMGVEMGAFWEAKTVLIKALMDVAKAETTRNRGK